MAAVIQTCPRCGTILSLPDDALNLLVCTCGASLLRRDDGTIADKPVEVLFGAAEPLQPGTTGVWDGRPFTLSGRIRAWFDDSVYNYWTVLFSDGALAWLGEGYGLYTLLFTYDREPMPTTGGFEFWKVGEARSLFRDEPFQVTSKDRCRRWELEGAVFLPRVRNSFDEYALASSAGRHFRLFELDEGPPVVMEAFPTSASALQFANLREAKSEVFVCPECGQESWNAYMPYVVSMACENCRLHLIRTENSNKFRRQGANDVPASPDLSVGATGRLRGIDYEVVGYARKRERVSLAAWREYVLWNALEGYAFLSEYDGHWIYLRQREDGPVVMKDTPRKIQVDAEWYELYNLYGYSVISAKGAFPYNIDNTGNIEVAEYISPPEMWSSENDRGRRIDWFWGEHIESNEVGEAFNVKGLLPRRQGIGAIEPRFYLAPGKLFLMALIGVLFLVAVHLVITGFTHERVVYEKTLYFSDIDSATSVSDPLVFDRASSNVEVAVHAPVTNSWVEVEASLVNRATGKEYGVQKGVEYYSGVDGGESWSEGSTSDEAYVTAVPAGTYVLQVQAIRERSLNSVDHVEVRVTYDVPSQRNLIIPVLLALCWPLIQYVRVSRNERQRWENSPFNPYPESDE